MARSVLLVCSGNSCRSPMAEAMLRKLVGDKCAVEISSAGLFALDGIRANESAVRTMAREGVDISAHRGRQITPEMIDASTLIVVMTAEHREALGAIAPHAMSKVFLVSDFEEDKKAHGLDIPDPIAQPPEVYGKCLQLMKGALANLALKLVRNEI